MWQPVSIVSQPASQLLRNLVYKISGFCVRNKTWHLQCLVAIQFSQTGKYSGKCGSLPHYVIFLIYLKLRILHLNVQFLTILSFSASFSVKQCKMMLIC